MGWWFDRRRGGLAGAAVALVALALLARGHWWWPSFRLPPRIEIEEAVADVSATLERSAVAQENPQAPVRIGGLTPSEKSNLNGGYHRAIIAVPPSLLRFRLRVPARAFLRFSLAMDEEERRQPDAAGVRFTVHVDGRPAYARAINPAARRADRGWLAGGLDLGAFGDREVEIALGTEAAGAGSLAGTPGSRCIRTAPIE